MEATAKPEIKVHDKLYVNGQWVTPKGAGMIDVINSTTEEVMGRVPEGAPEDVNDAVAAARAAFEKWSTTPIEERARYLQ
ncbi:MAG: aldehyde dehydrogenase family protein, partial [Blastocatellia bacterium]